MAWSIDLLSTPSQHDIAYSWVSAILPSGMDSPYGVAVGTFASAATFLASLFVGYHILVGIISSAYSGKVLGEKYHQIWAPLRVVFGFGLLIPIAGGFSSAHYLLRDMVAVPSINLGNATWTTFVAQVAEDEKPIIARPAGGSKLVLDVLEHEICSAVTNAAGNVWGFSAPAPPVDGKEVGAGWFFGSNNRVQWDYGQDCGRLSVGLMSDHAEFSATRRAAVGQIVAAVRKHAATYAELFQKFDMALSPDQAVKGVVMGKLPVDLFQKIRNAGAAYDAAIAAAAKKDVSEVATEARGKLVAAARQDGWINAGAYWHGLAQISELTNALTGEQPEQVAVRYGDGNSGFERNVKAAIETLRYQIAGEEARVGLTANDLAAAGDESAGFMSRALAPLTRGIGEWLASRDPDADPVARMISDGHAMMNVSAGVVVGTGVAVGLANTAPGKAIGADGVASWFASFVWMPAVVLWLLGAMRAYVLPFLPFVFVFMGAVKWGGAILEASIALIVWSFIWVRMDGDELISQQQRTGGMLLFNIALRPVLIVLALCASYLLLTITYGTLDRLLPTAFYGQTGGRATALGALLVILTIKTFLQWFLAVHLTGMCSDLPDRIGEWFGVPGAGKMGDRGGVEAAAMGAAAVIGQAKGAGNVGKLPMPKKPDPEGNGGKPSDVGGVTSRRNP